MWFTCLQVKRTVERQQHPLQTLQGCHRVIRRELIFNLYTLYYTPFGTPYLGKATCTAATRAALPSLTTAYWVLLFSCFRNPPKTDGLQDL